MKTYKIIIQGKAQAIPYETIIEAEDIKQIINKLEDSPHRICDIISITAI